MVDCIFCNRPIEVSIWLKLGVYLQHCWVFLCAKDFISQILTIFLTSQRPSSNIQWSSIFFVSWVEVDRVFLRLSIKVQSSILEGVGEVETNLSSKALSKTSRSSSSMIPMCFIMDSKTLPYTKPQLISLILECLNVCVGGMLFLLPSIMLGGIAITSRNWLLDCSENIGLPCSSPQWHHLDF